MAGRLTWMGDRRPMPNYSQRLLLVVDLLLALILLSFAVPKSLVPEDPGHYWSSDVLQVNRAIALVLLLIAIFAVAAWFYKIARNVLVILISIPALNAFNNFRLEIQFNLTENVEFSSLIHGSEYWTSVSIELIPIVLMGLHFWFFFLRRTTH